MLSHRDDGFRGSDTWNKTQIHVSYIGSKPVNGGVTYPIYFKTVLAFVTRGTFINHQQWFSFKIDGLTNIVTELT